MLLYLCNDNYEDMPECICATEYAVEHQEQGLEMREDVAYEFEPWIQYYGKKI